MVGGVVMLGTAGLCAVKRSCEVAWGVIIFGTLRFLTRITLMFRTLSADFAHGLFHDAPKRILVG